MPVDNKYILFNIKNDKLSIFCILTHRYGKHRKSQSMKDLWTLIVTSIFLKLNYIYLIKLIKQIKYIIPL
jgi:hypothetical protein